MIKNLLMSFREHMIRGSIMWRRFTITWLRYITGSGDYQKALEYQKIALVMLETILHLEHPYIVACYYNMALIYQGLGEHLKALEYEEKYRSIWEGTPTPKPSYVKTSYHIPGGYQGIGSYEEAMGCQ